MEQIKFTYTEDDLSKLDKSLFTFKAYVTEVTDGDTIVAVRDKGFGEQKIDKYRIYLEEGTYFDTPEVINYKSVNEEHLAHGKAASARAKELLLNKFVYIRTHKRGSFRYLAEVILMDGTVYADQMIEEGFQKRKTYE